MKCVHGQPMEETLEGHPHQKELEDPEDYGIMEFYQTCDCCMCVMHNDSGSGILQENQTVFCKECDQGERRKELSKISVC